MNDKDKTTFLQVAFTHFVPCFFLGVISLFIIQSLFPKDVFRELIDNSIGTIDIALATVNGIFVSGCAALFHWLHNHRVRKGIAWLNQPASREKISYAALVGFSSGASDILFGLHNTGIIALTLFVLAILIWHLRKIGRAHV